jgi:hypothetical protein
LRVKRTLLFLELLEDRRLLSGEPAWESFAHDAQHSGLSDAPAQSIDLIRWQLANAGAPVITPANTVIVPITVNGRNSLEGHRASDGGLLWTQTSDYNGFSFAPVLTPAGRLYFPGAGGTVYYCDDPDDVGATTTGRLAFYGIADHDPNLDGTVNITTPMTTDCNGAIYFGFTANPGNSLNLQNGIARMDVNGNGTWISANTAAGDPTVTEVPMGCAPALSNDGRVVYIAVVNGANGNGYLVSLDSTTLQPLAQVPLLDPRSGRPAGVGGQSSATPMVGPDGDVYYGVRESPFGSNDYRGWMLHFSADLSQEKIPGAFGWDTTASVVPSDLVPSYDGPSSYLIATKYNRYTEGIYQIGLLDPNVAMVDPYSHADVMNEVETVDGPSGHYEWCINDAAVDPYSGSIFANSEDGYLYRWDLASNRIIQGARLNGGYMEAYTPTLIGPDGTVYSINGGSLYAAQAMPSSDGPVQPHQAGMLQGVREIAVAERPSTLVPRGPGSETDARFSRDFYEALEIAGAWPITGAGMQTESDKESTFVLTRLMSNRVPARPPVYCDVAEAFLNAEELAVP